MKQRIAFTLIMNLPIAISIALTAQLLAIGKVIVDLLLINFCIAYALSFVIGMTIPVVKLGVGFAIKCGAKPDTLKFGLLVNVIVDLIYVALNIIVMSYFNVIILEGAPMIAYFMGMATMFVPIYIVGYIVSFLWNRPAENIAKKICGA